MKNHTHKYLTLPTLILLLAACGSSEPADQTVPLGNSHKATGTAHPNPSPSSSGNSSAKNSEPSSSSSAGDTTSVPTLAGGQEATLTEAELADYRAGKYVPATEKHPAYNVPVPEIPAVAKEQTVEGAIAAAQYWIEAKNYTMQTGDPSHELLVLADDWSVGQELAENYKSFYDNDSWAYQCFDRTRIDAAEGNSISEPTEVTVDIFPFDETCKIIDSDGKLTHDLPEVNYNGQRSNMFMSWDGEGWKVTNQSGIEGVDYGA